MSVESHILTEELGDKGHWLRKFRKAKNLNTLQLMVSNAIDKHHNPGHRGSHLPGRVPARARAGAGTPAGPLRSA